MTPSLAFLFFAAALCFSQSAEKPPAFEAADVHPSAREGNQLMPSSAGWMQYNVRAGRMRLRNYPMANLIAQAYGIDVAKVYGGPAWLEMDHFDITAKLPEKSTRESQRKMLQALLEERFHLSVHNDTRPIPVYLLTAGKHPLLKEAEKSGESGCRYVPARQGGTFNYACRGESMQAFAAQLRQYGPSFLYLSGTPVVDKTGLQGSWDFDFQYTGRNLPGNAETITLFEAMDKLGLKLELGTAPLEVLVVDRVNETPAGNPEGTTEKLGETEAATEFEVADIKPTAPDFRGMRFQIQPGGRVNLTGVNLEFLIKQAWDVNDDTLFGGPKWLGSERFDIVAKMPSDGSPQVDTNQVWLMLRALLKERFKLAVHTEQREAKAYTLVAVKPKMKPADPASRTRVTEGPGPDGKDPRDRNPLLARLVTCQNMTMAQFAEQLQTLASGYIHTPVLDATGLRGGWDFTLSFSPAGMDNIARARAVEPSSEGQVRAIDPSGAVTLFEAVERQLGLRLEMHKRQATVLVIDHIEQTPTEN